MYVQGQFQADHYPIDARMAASLPLLVRPVGPDHGPDAFAVIVDLLDAHLSAQRLDQNQTPAALSVRVRRKRRRQSGFATWHLIVDINPHTGPDSAQQQLQRRSSIADGVTH